VTQRWTFLVGAVIIILVLGFASAHCQWRASPIWTVIASTDSMYTRCDSLLRAKEYNELYGLIALHSPQIMMLAPGDAFAVVNHYGKGKIFIHIPNSLYLYIAPVMLLKH
jgi:hypothetical protein